MKRAFACALLLASAALAAPHWPKQGKRLQSLPAALRVLPAGGGQSQLVQLCDAVQASDLVGNWFCYYGSTGTMRAGSAATFANVGSPATQTLPVCPNGANCALVSRLRGNAATDYAKTANVAFPTGTHSICWGGSLDSFATSQAPVAKASTFAAANTVTGIDVTNVGSPEFFISNGAALSIVSAGTMVARARHLVCGTYQLVGAGTSVMKLYLDGPQVGATLSTAGAIQTLSNIPFDLGRSDTGTEPMTGTWEGVLVTDSVLSATSVQQLADAFLGKLSGSGGETLTFTRASSAGCENEDGSVVMDLPNNRPCVTRGRVATNPAWTELLLRTSEFDNAAWVKGSQVIAAPTVTANTTDVADPGGAFLAEKLSYPAVQNAGEASYVFQAFTATAAAYSMGVWLRTLSGTATVYLFANDAGYKGVVACPVTATWSRCKSENFTGAALATNYFLGVDLRSGSGQSAQPAQTIYAWRYNLVQAPILQMGGIDASASTVNVAATESKLTGLSLPMGTTTSFSEDVQFGDYGRTQYIASAGVDSTHRWDYYVSGQGFSCEWFNGSSFASSNPTNLTNGVKYHLGCFYDGVNVNACVNGACTATAKSFTASSPLTTFYIGGDFGVASNAGGGTAGSACFGSSPGACQ